MPLSLQLGGMPVEWVLSLQSLLGLAAALGAGWILLWLLERRRPGELGFDWRGRATLREIGLGLLIGGAPIAVGAVLLALAGALGYAAQGGSLVAWAAAVAEDFAILAPPAATEEALFRGYPFQVLVGWIGAVPAALITSAGFAAAHAGNPNIGAIGFANIFLAGVLLAAAYIVTRSLWFATAVHLGWNWTMASLLDLPVSGLTWFDTPLYEPAGLGPAWLTGGDFGPEGGLIGTFASALGLFAVLRWAPRRAEPGEAVA